MVRFKRGVCQAILTSLKPAILLNSALLNRSPHCNSISYAVQKAIPENGFSDKSIFQQDFPEHPFLSFSTIKKGFTYLQSMDFQRGPQSKHHLYCEQEKPAHCHGSLLLRLGTHQIQNRTRGAHKISPHGTMTKRTPAVNWDHAVSWGGGLG